MQEAVGGEVTFTHTSLLVVNTLLSRASGAVHLTGIFPCKSEKDTL